MQLLDLLTPDRVDVQPIAEGSPLDKPKALARLGALLARGTPLPAEEVERVLGEREELQSTGIGEGVAIPHGALTAVDDQRAALLLVPRGMDFQSIDGEPVTILFAVLGPKRAAGEHLKTLARVSRLLRHRGFRDRLLGAANGQAAFEILAAEEAERNALGER